MRGIKIVLINQSDCLLLTGVDSLLTDETDPDLVVTIREGETDLIQQVEQHRPQVVVVGDHLPGEYLSKLLMIMKEFSLLRIVVISEQDNHLIVYDKYQVSLDCLDDFVSIISEQIVPL
jgi:DNA-binding NarL/FixJ family response regulator